MQAVSIFISVLLHELGHVYIAKILKLRVEEVELFPFGGVARMEDITKYGGLLETFVAISGPVVSLLLVMLSFILSLFSSFFQVLMEYNKILFLFNLIPVLPMDGGRIARNILLHYMGYKQATKIMVYLGRIFSIMLVLYNIIRIMEGEKSGAYLLISVFIYMGTVKEMRFCSYYYLLNRNNKKIKMIKKRVIRKRELNVHEDTYIRFAASQFSPSSLCEIIVLNPSGKVLKVLSEADIMEGIIKYGYDGKIAQILKSQ